MSPDRPPQQWLAEDAALMGGGALLITSSVIHLLLWSESYRQVEPLGQLLVLMSVIGILLAVAAIRLGTFGLVLASAVYLFFTTTIVLLSTSFNLLGYMEGMPAPYSGRSIGVPIVGLALLLGTAWLISPPSRKPKPVPAAPPAAAEQPPEPEAAASPEPASDGVERIRWPAQRPHPMQQVSTETESEPDSPAVEEPPEEALAASREIQEVAAEPQVAERAEEPVNVAAEPPAPEPVGEERPVPEPLAETPVPEPVAEEAPVPEPVAEERPVPEPVAQEVPVPEPVAQEAPVPEPVGEEAPVPEPVAEEAPTSEPAANEVRSSEPVAAEAPGAEPATVEVEVEAVPVAADGDLPEAPEPTEELTAPPEPIPDTIHDPIRSMLVREYEILERIMLALGPDDPGTLTIRSNIAGYYVAAGDVWRAADLQEGIAADSARILGPAHAHTKTAQGKATQWRKIAKKKRRPKVPVSK
ncbi:MAG TPA: hypothetical protein VEU28_02960 [Actinomycetota bacterium]|nr:hypothetical protein [Actinomycetota bacterium]